jgi:hypothetical protein
MTMSKHLIAAIFAVLTACSNRTAPTTPTQPQPAVTHAPKGLQVGIGGCTTKPEVDVMPVADVPAELTLHGGSCSI